MCGLYLQRDLALPSNRARPWVYTNFIVSLDGRIAIDQPHRGTQGIPDAITNPRDWRLFQELAAQADALITSDRYLRELAEGAAKVTVPVSSAPEYSDLRQWRKARGLPEQPALVVLSASLKLPPNTLYSSLDRSVYIATGQDKQSEALQRLSGTEVRLLFASSGKRVQGRALIEARFGHGHRFVRVTIRRARPSAGALGSRAPCAKGVCGRDACGYALANKGHDLRTIQDYLGNRDPKHTAVYTRTAAKRFEKLWR